MIKIYAILILTMFAGGFLMSYWGDITHLFSVIYSKIFIHQFWPALDNLFFAVASMIIVITGALTLATNTSRGRGEFSWWE